MKVNLAKVPERLLNSIPDGMKFIKKQENEFLVVEYNNIHISLFSHYGICAAISRLLVILECRKLFRDPDPYPCNEYLCRQRSLLRVYRICQNA